MKTPLLLAFTSLTMAGCAGMDAGECRSANKDYLAGWVDGYREWNTRVSGSECCGAR